MSLLEDIRALGGDEDELALLDGLSDNSADEAVVAAPAPTDVRLDATKSRFADFCSQKALAKDLKALLKSLDFGTHAGAAVESESEESEAPTPPAPVVAPKPEPKAKAAVVAPKPNPAVATPAPAPQPTASTSTIKFEAPKGAWVRLLTPNRADTTARRAAAGLARVRALAAAAG